MEVAYSALSDQSWHTRSGRHACCFSEDRTRILNDVEATVIRFTWFVLWAMWLLASSAAAQGTLAVTKTDDRETVIPGARQSYVITVTNEGSDEVVGARVTDVLPAEMVDSQWTCSAEQGSGSSSRFPFLEAESIDSGVALVVSPDGLHLYVANLGGDGVAVFARDSASDGAAHLDFVELAQAEGLDGPSALAISPDGSRLYVTGINDNSLNVFDRDALSGELTFRQRLRDNVDGVDGLRGAAGIALDSAGHHVYVTARNEAAVSVFGRDAASGELTFLEVQENGIAGVAGLIGASGIAVTPDGAHVIVAGRFEDSLVVFEREPETLGNGVPNPDYGQLRYLETLRQGVAGAAGLDQPLDLDVSPDGFHLYVAAAGTEALSVYRRIHDPQNPGFGLLSFQQLLVDGIGDIEGLAGARSVEVSRDGLQVYGAGQSDDALAIFSRNDEPASADFGRLRFLEVRRDGVDSVDGLAGAYAVTTSPDGAHIYAAGFDDNAVAAFGRRVSSRCTSSGQGHIDDTVDLSPGGGLTYQLAGRIEPGAAGILTNTVEVSTAEGDRFAATDSSTLEPEHDLSVTKTHGSGQVIVGTVSTYTLRIGNAGPSEARDVAIHDVLPAEFFVAEEASWTCLAVGAGGSQCPAGGDGEVNVEVTLSPGDELVFTIEARARPDVLGLPCSFDPDGRCVTSTATVADASDPEPGNNVAVAETRIVRESALEILKDHTLTGTEPAAGEDVGYVITVINHGPSSVLGATVSDVFPSRFEAVSWTCTTAGPGDSCGDNPAGQGDLLAVVGIAAGSSVRFEATGRLTPSAEPGALENTADVQLPEGTEDPEASDNIAVADGLTVVRRADLSITKSLVDGPPVAGAETRFRIVVENAGPSDAPGTLVEDVFSEALHQVTWTCEPEPIPGAHCSAGGDGHLRDVADIPAGGQVVYVATGMLVPSAEGDLENIARVVAGEGVSDPDSGNNSSTIVIPIERSSDLTLTQELCESEASSGTLLCPGAPGAVAGEAVEFAVTVRNDGPSEAAFTFVDELDLFDAETGAGVLVPGSVSWQCVGDPILDAIGVQRDGEGGTDGLAAVSDVVLSPEGAHVLVAAPGDDAVAVFRRENDGTLTWRQAIFDDAPAEGLSGAEGLAIAPDGRHVYVTAGQDHALVLLRRQTDAQHPDFGTLEFVEALFDGEDGIDGLLGAARVRVSRDGAFVYVTGEQSGAVSVFARAAEDGRLTLVDRERNGLDGVPLQALDGAYALVLSPDPEQSRLYVGAQQAGAVSVFERDPASGELEFLEVVRNGDVHAHPSGTRTVQGLEQVRDLALSPQGGHLYGAGLESDSIVVLDHGDATECGSRPAPCLLFVQRLPDLDGASSVAVSVDGQRVYAAVRNESALAVFRRHAQTGTLEPGGVVEGADLRGARSLAVAQDGTLYAGAELADTLSVWSSPPAAICSGGAGNRIEEDVLLAPGAEVVFHVHGTVSSAAVGELVNVAGADLDGDGIVEVVSPELVATLQREADLQITKDDGIIDVRAGETVTYTITVSNPGPSDLSAARVMDPPPGEPPPDLLDAHWTCVGEDGADCGSASGPFPIDEEVDLPAGSRAVYTLTGTVAPTDAATLVNQASVDVPAGAVEREPADNLDADVNQLVAFVDLAVTLENGVTAVVPGEEVTYSLVVSNGASGTIAPASAVVRNVVPSTLQGVQWTCVAENGADCGPGTTGSGPLDERVTLPEGGTLTYSIRGVVDPSATGNLVGEATVVPGAPHTDPNPDNDIARDIDPLRSEADLVVELQSGGCGGLVYEVEVHNAGPSDAQDVLLEMILPDGVSLVAFEGCAGEPIGGDTTCELGALAAGASADVVLHTDVLKDDLDETSVAVSSTTQEQHPSDNVDTVATVYAAGCVFEDGFETGDVSAWSTLDLTRLPAFLRASSSPEDRPSETGGDGLDSLSASFRVDTWKVFLTEGRHRTLFAGLDEKEEPLFGLEIGRFDGGLEVLIWTRTAAGSSTSGWRPLGSGKLLLELEWRSGDQGSADQGSPKGVLRLRQDGAVIAELNDLENPGQRCGLLRFATGTVGPVSSAVQDFTWHSRRISP